MAALVGDTLAARKTAAQFDAKILGQLQQEHRGGAGDHNGLLWGLINLHLRRKGYGV